MPKVTITKETGNRPARELLAPGDYELEIVDHACGVTQKGDDKWTTGGFWEANPRGGLRPARKDPSLGFISVNKPFNLLEYNLMISSLERAFDFFSIKFRSSLSKDKPFEFLNFILLLILELSVPSINSAQEHSQLQ